VGKTRFGAVVGGHILPPRDKNDRITYGFIRFVDEKSAANALAAKIPIPGEKEGAFFGVQIARRKEFDRDGIYGHFSANYLYVQGIPHEIQVQEISQILSAYGEIMSIQFVRPVESSNNKYGGNAAIVQMRTPQQALATICALDEQKIPSMNNQKLSVLLANDSKYTPSNGYHTKKYVDRTFDRTFPTDESALPIQNTKTMPPFWQMLPTHFTPPAYFKNPPAMPQKLEPMPQQFLPVNEKTNVEKTNVDLPDVTGGETSYDDGTLPDENQIQAETNNNIGTKFNPAVAWMIATDGLAYPGRIDANTNLFVPYLDARGLALHHFSQQQDVLPMLPPRPYHQQQQQQQPQQQQPQHSLPHQSQQQQPPLPSQYQPQPHPHPQVQQQVQQQHSLLPQPQQQQPQLPPPQYQSLPPQHQQAAEYQWQALLQPQSGSSVYRQQHHAHHPPQPVLRASVVGAPVWLGRPITSVNKSVPSTPNVDLVRSYQKPLPSPVYLEALATVNAQWQADFQQKQLMHRFVHAQLPSATVPMPSASVPMPLATVHMPSASVPNASYTPEVHPAIVVASIKLPDA